MKGIKTAITFLVGAIEASLWWACYMPQFVEYKDGLLFFAFSLTAMILLGVSIWLLEHWDDCN